MDISILIPGIRPHLWEGVVGGIREACKRYTYEVVFAGPFDPPPGLGDNVRYIKTYRCPSSTAQMAAGQCEGRMLLHSVDDSRWLPDGVDLAMDLWTSLNDRKAMVNCRYTEGDNYQCPTFPTQYWYAYHHPALHAPGVPRHFQIALHFLMDMGYFKELGGFDCSYEYQNFNLHDFAYRVQHDGGSLHLSPTDVTNCDHISGRGDHVVIERTHDIDLMRYRAKYGNPNALNEPSGVRIPFDNWQQQPEVWARRFPRLFTSYDEMMRG